jgi:phosphatidylserine synthase 2
MRNIMDTFDMHVIAHFLGYVFKMIIIRDVPLVWMVSLGFEWMELTFRHWLNNFHECWWDHLLFDLFGMNFLGLCLGVIWVKAFKMKRFPWVYKENTEIQR